MSDPKDSWINRHFATLATALISLATLSFSYVQWHVAQINSQTAALERQRLEEQDRQRRDEEWSFKALEFVFRNERHFFGNDPADFQRAVRMLAVGFPDRISAPILKRLESQATPAQRLELETVRAQMQGEPPPPRPVPPISRAPAPVRSVAAERPRPIREARPDRPRVLEPVREERPQVLPPPPQPLRDRLPERPRRRDR